MSDSLQPHGLQHSSFPVHGVAKSQTQLSDWTKTTIQEEMRFKKAKLLSWCHVLPNWWHHDLSLIWPWCFFISLNLLLFMSQFKKKKAYFIRVTSLTGKRFLSSCFGVNLFARGNTVCVDIRRLFRSSVMDHCNTSWRSIYLTHNPENWLEKWWVSLPQWWQQPVQRLMKFCLCPICVCSLESPRVTLPWVSLQPWCPFSSGFSPCQT